MHRNDVQIRNEGLRDELGQGRDGFTVALNRSVPILDIGDKISGLVTKSFFEVVVMPELGRKLMLTKCQCTLYVMASVTRCWKIG